MARVKLKYVHSFKDRHSKVRHYFRRAGFKHVPLPGLPGSSGFMEAYQAALSGAELQPKAGLPLKAGTIAALVRAYLNSLAFGNLSPEFQRVRRNILERFESEHGDKRVALLQRVHIEQMVAAKKAVPFAARNFFNSLRALMAFAIEAGMINADPTVGAKRVKAKSDGFRTWTEADIVAFEEKHLVGSRARLAFALLLYTGQRRSDVVRMGRQHLRDGAIAVRQCKTGTPLSIPLHAELNRAIAASPIDQLTFLITKGGKPFSPAGFTNWFRTCCNEAALPKGTSAHGLRKATCRRLAEAGCSANVIAAISGHRSLREIERYTRAADQARMAQSAITALEFKQATKIGKPR